MLGLKPAERQPGWGADDYTTPLAAYAAEGAVQLERVGLGLMFGAAEPELRQDWPQWTTAAARRRFAFLEAQGYVVSPAEQLELDGKAPR